MSAAIIRGLGEHGPLAAWQAFEDLQARIAMNAVLGELPDAEVRAEFFALNDARLAEARRV